MCKYDEPFGPTDVLIKRLDKLNEESLKELRRMSDKHILSKEELTKLKGEGTK